jgi:hypothetical protein
VSTIEEYRSKETAVKQQIAELIKQGVRFRNIPCYPGYKAGSNGAILSCKKIGRSNRKRGPWRFLDQHSLGRPGRHGELKYVGLSAGNNRSVRRYVHRLVLEAFVGPRPAGLECRHLDGNPSNNDLSNLVWGTRKENVEDMQRHGRVGKSRGASHPRALFTEDDIREIRKSHASGVSMGELARRFHATPSCILWIVRRWTWKHVSE